MCPGCRKEKASLVHHYAVKESCRRAAHLASAALHGQQQAQHSAQGAHNAAADSLYHHIMRDMVSEDIADRRYSAYIEESCIEHFLRMVRKWLAFAADELKLALKEHLKEHCVEAGNKAIDSSLDIFNGLETPALRYAYLKRTHPFIQPIIRSFGPVGHAVDLPVVSTLSRLLQYNPVAREHCIATSTEWKKGTLWKQQAEVIADVTDGNNCRFHPHLMRPATDLESRDIRIGIGFYGDGIEVRLNFVHWCVMRASVPLQHIYLVGARS